jgi:Natural resistance-associated macrophage protein
LERQESALDPDPDNDRSDCGAGNGSRMGAVTGKGLHDLIRQEFGIRATFFVSLVFGLADLGHIVAEFAGLASGMGLFGISKYVVVPIGAFLVWVVVVYNSYQPFERILILFCVPGLGVSCASELACRNSRHIRPQSCEEFRLPGHGCGPDWHNYHTLDAVLSASFNRCERHRQETVLACQVGRYFRMHHNGRDRVLYRVILRRYAICFRISEHL